MARVSLPARSTLWTDPSLHQAVALDTSSETLGKIYGDERRFRIVFVLDERKDIDALLLECA